MKIVHLANQTEPEVIYAALRGNYIYVASMVKQLFFLYMKLFVCIEPLKQLGSIWKFYQLNSI